MLTQWTHLWRQEKTHCGFEIDQSDSVINLAYLKNRWSNSERLVAPVNRVFIEFNDLPVILQTSEIKNAYLLLSQIKSNRIINNANATPPSVTKTMIQRCLFQVPWFLDKNLDSLQVAVTKALATELLTDMMWIPLYPHAIEEMNSQQQVPIIPTANQEYVFVVIIDDIINDSEIVKRMALEASTQFGRNTTVCLLSHYSSNKVMAAFGTTINCSDVFEFKITAS